jgi:2-C-methyl-D-erythritol 2,4-cyclodiphosphate synthase
MGLVGHSDADVICHALIDAICGAAGLGDIGALYPDTSEEFRDARSLDLLGHTLERCKAAGFRIENCDVTLIAQAPKLAPYREEMRANLARVLEIEPKAVGLKGTTTDHLGLIGKGEAVAAQAVVLLHEAR